MPDMKKALGKKDGFSLVELIITISIIAILTGLAAFGFGYLRTPKGWQMPLTAGCRI